jgi:hypothetical protein
MLAKKATRRVLAVMRDWRVGQVEIGPVMDVGV